LFDLIIANGTVIDGTGAPGIKSDIGIVGERIEAIDALVGAQAHRMIDAKGLVVSPGFVDPHTHSDADLLIDPQHAYGLRQGITTEILGLGGISFAPLSKPNYRMYTRWLAGILGDPPEDADMSSITSFRANYHRKVAINTAYLVPSGAIRIEVVGFRSGRLDDSQMQAAVRLVRESLEQGAVGFSNTTHNYPGTWSDTTELISLAKAVRDGGGIYVDASEPFNARRAYGAAQGPPEWLEIARKSGARMHFAHYRTGPRTSGKANEIMADRDAARAEGIDFTLDIYPYPTGGTVPVTFLSSSFQEGGPDAILKRLSDPNQRKTAAEYLEKNQNPVRLKELESMVLSYVAGDPELEGRTLKDVAIRRGMSPGEALCSVLLENDLKVGYWGEPPDASVWRQIDQDAMDLLARPDYMVCSDITPAGGKPHPRTYGAYPRFLGRFRREIGRITLEGMIERMTDRPARRYGITHRGRIQKGYFADLTVFDPDSIADTATYDEPCQFPVGIPYVVVNGLVAVDNDQCTGVLAGQAVP
jgi:N-acyl-D-amino-acid deacylase